MIDSLHFPASMEKCKLTHILDTLMSAMVAKKDFITYLLNPRETLLMIQLLSGLMAVQAAHPFLDCSKRTALMLWTRNWTQLIKKMSTHGTNKQTCFTLNNQLVLDFQPGLLQKEHQGRPMTPFHLQMHCQLFYFGTVQASQNIKQTICIFLEKVTEESMFHILLGEFTNITLTLQIKQTKLTSKAFWSEMEPQTGTLTYLQASQIPYMVSILFQSIYMTS